MHPTDSHVHSLSLHSRYTKITGWDGRLDTSRRRTEFQGLRYYVDDCDAIENRIVIHRISRRLYRSISANVTVSRVFPFRAVARNDITRNNSSSFSGIRSRGSSFGRELEPFYRDLEQGRRRVSHLAHADN